MAELKRITKDELILNILSLWYGIPVYEVERICREYMEQEKQKEKGEPAERTPKEKQTVLK